MVKYVQIVYNMMINKYILHCCYIYISKYEYSSGLSEVYFELIIKWT